MATQIPLTQGKFALVDESDYENLTQWKWRYHPQGYAIAHDYSGGKDKTLRMHRLITAAPAGKDVDHINGNGLDNRRSNLRVVTHQQNTINTALRKDNKSGHKGVHWYKAYKKWQVYINFNGKRKSLGYFADINDAIEAYRKAAEIYHGEFARVS